MNKNMNFLGLLQGQGPVPWYQAFNFHSTVDFDLAKLFNFAKSSFFFKALADKKAAHDWAGHVDGSKADLEMLCQEICQLGYILIYRTEQDMSHLYLLSKDDAALVLSMDEGNPCIKFNVITTDFALLTKIREIFNKHNEQMATD